MTEHNRINRIQIEIHPELAESLHAIPIIVDGEVVYEPVVHHPLVVELAFQPERINRLYLQKREIERRLKGQGKLLELLGLYERPYRLITVVDWIASEAAPPDKLREMLVWAWVDAEDTDVVAVEELVRAFRLLRPADGEPIRDNAETPVPRVPIEIYHGGESDDSMSWTSDRVIAQWFATRWTRTPKPVWAATIPPEGVLALLSGRSEAEVVVDPEFLLDVRRGDRYGDKTGSQSDG